MGYSSVLPSRGWAGGGAVDIAIVHGSDTMIDPGERGRGDFGRLWAGLVDASAGADIYLACSSDLIHAWHAKRSTQVMFGRMRGWVRFVDSEEMAAKLRGPRALARAAARTVTRSQALIDRTSRSRGVVIADVNASGVSAEFERVGRKVAAQVPFMLARDVPTIRWRWFDQPGRAWRVRGARSTGGTLLGWAVHGAATDDGARVGEIVDLVAFEPRIARALVIDAVEQLRPSGAAVVEFDCLDPRPWSARMMARAGFLPRGVGPRVSCKVVNPVWTKAAARDSWFMTLGDTDLR